MLGEVYGSLFPELLKERNLMPKAQQSPDYSFWIGKKEAAEMLQVSTKSVEKFHADGKIHGVSWRRPSGGPRIMVYHPGDIETLRTERLHTPAAAFIMPATGVANTDNLPAENGVLEMDGARILQLLGALSQKLLEGSQKSKNSKPEVPIASRVLLTVREAAAYVGAPEYQVRAEIAAGRLYARKEGFTRVRRTDLDKLWA